MTAAEYPLAEAWVNVIIVGGGASGAFLALHLLRDRACELRVTLMRNDLKSVAASPISPPVPIIYSTSAPRI